MHIWRNQLTTGYYIPLSLWFGEASPSLLPEALNLGEEYFFAAVSPQQRSVTYKYLLAISRPLVLALYPHSTWLALSCHVARAKCDSQSFSASNTCTLVQGTRRSPCPNNANRKLAMNLVSQSVVHWPSALSLPGSLLEQQSFSPTPDLLVRAWLSQNPQMISTYSIVSEPQLRF